MNTPDFYEGMPEATVFPEIEVKQTTLVVAVAALPTRPCRIVAPGINPVCPVAERLPARRAAGWGHPAVRPEAQPIAGLRKPDMAYRPAVTGGRARRCPGGQVKFDGGGAAQKRYQLQKAFPGRVDCRRSRRNGVSCQACLPQAADQGGAVDCRIVGIGRAQ